MKMGLERNPHAQTYIDMSDNQIVIIYDCSRNPVLCLKTWDWMTVPVKLQHRAQITSQYFSFNLVTFKSCRYLPSSPHPSSSLLTSAAIASLPSRPRVPGLWLKAVSTAAAAAKSPRESFFSSRARARANFFESNLDWLWIFNNFLFNFQFSLC